MAVLENRLRAQERLYDSLHQDPAQRRLMVYSPHITRAALPAVLAVYISVVMLAAFRSYLNP